MPNIELIHGDCMDYMLDLPDNAFDAIITDPPYFRVKGHAWDNQWDTDSGFLDWVGDLVEQFDRLLKPNGSLYFFASPRMAARVEVKIAERFNVLNHITWRKGRAGMKAQGWGQKAEKEALRCFIPETEKLIFAEHYNSDNFARGESSYVGKCNELRGFVFEPLRAYLDGERQRAGFSPRQCNEACGNQMANHYFSKVQWALPTQDNYNKLRAAFNSQTGDKYLRKEYEELRKEYEELRRPFSLSANDQWGDVWDFDPVIGYPGKHPCEKPQALLNHILKTSVRQGSKVFDPFLGSGSMAIACHHFGCDFVGAELDPDYYKAACERFERETAQESLF